MVGIIPNESIASCYRDKPDWEYSCYLYVHLALAVCYGVLCLLCVFHCFYKIYSSQTSQTWHNLFYPLLFVGSAMRGIFMVSQFLQETTPSYSTAPIIMVIFSFGPSFFFFSAYLIILFRWAQIYHNSYDMASFKVDHLRIMFYVANGLMYVVIIILLGADLLSGYAQQNTSPCLIGNDPIQYAISGLCTALYILTPLGFALYTFRITRKFRYLPARSPAKREVSLKLQRFTILVLVVFTCRAIFTAYSNINHHKNMSIEYPWSDGVYYFVLEIVPLVLMFLILRMHTSKHLDSHSSGPSATTPLINHTIAFA